MEGALNWPRRSCRLGKHPRKRLAPFFGGVVEGPELPAVPTGAAAPGAGAAGGSQGSAPPVLPPAHCFPSPQHHPRIAYFCCRLYLRSAI